MVLNHLIYLILIIMGYCLSSKLNFNVTKVSWIIIIFFCLISRFIGISTSITFFDYSIFLNNILFAISLGVLLRLSIITIKKLL